MPASTFEKISSSDTLLYGPRKLLLCGFSPKAQTNFKTLLDLLEIRQLPLVWITSQEAPKSLQALLQLPDGTGEGRPSTLPRAVVVAGITENELQRLMSGCRKSGMQQALWATVTPTSQKWRLQKLLAELAAEHQALSQRRPPHT